jgi:apolipoprotein N-acyltransferase
MKKPFLEGLLPLVALTGFLIPLAHLIRGPWMMERSGGTGEDLITVLLLLFHALWLLTIAGSGPGGMRKRLRRMAVGSELLLVPSLVFFLFAIIFAANANMSYAQWFAETSGNIRLAPDSTIQRLNAALRFLPLAILDSFFYVVSRTGRRGRILKHYRKGFSIQVGTWSTLLALASAVLVTLSFSSPLALRGLPLLAFLAPVPLLLVLASCPFPQAFFAGVSFGALQALLGNYWLGTYDLLSLHFVTVYHTAVYSLFIPVLLIASRSIPGKAGSSGYRLRFLLMVLVWTSFDYVRSIGFLGYPWGILGTSQYEILPLIQIASLFGVWGVNLFVWLWAALAASLVEGFFSFPDKGSGKGPGKGPGRLRKAEAWTLGVITLLTLGSGTFMLLSWNSRVPADEITVALIQQSTDPRKDDYEKTFSILKALSLDATGRAADFSVLEDPPAILRLSDKPVELLAWSETAFVPNIRRWGAMDPSAHPNADLVHRFRRFQKELGTWLLTGNDDYEDVEGEQQGRNHYNAAVLFSDTGERTGTYRKIHMVPFSEYFPYEEQFPLLYKLLLEFDANLWEAGDAPVVLSHPRADFITPICFEDSFPGEVAEQVNLGVDLILNISNDFWSLTETEGQQHAANSIFRAVESRRPLLRSTASGLTAVVAPSGKILAELPHYVPGYIVADLQLYGRPETFYLRHIDLLPKATLLITILLLFLYPGWRRLRASG